RGPERAARAYTVWQAQRELAIIRARPVTATNPSRDARPEALAAEVAAGQAALGGRVFRIPTETLSELRRRIEQLDRRAHKLGTAPITLHDVADAGPDGRRDFLGGHDPDRACRQAEYLELARTTLGDADRSTPARGGPGTVELPLAAFAACAAHVVRAHGWVSREQARRSSRPATADA